MIPYATQDDVIAVLPPNKRLPAGIQQMLVRASRDVATAIRSAIYDPDSADIKATLREATAEQVAAWCPSGEDGTRSGAGYGDVAIGSARVSRNLGPTGLPPGYVSGLAPQAYNVLQLAGLLPASPQSRDC